METNTQHDWIALEAARDRVRRIQKFYKHLFVFGIGLILYIAKTYFGAPLNFFPIHFLNTTVMYCWTFILAVQGMKLWVIQNWLGRDWEQKQIRKIMDKENKSL